MAYLGKTPSQAVRSRYYYTATGGETSLSGADDNANVLTFTDGNYVDVALNGVALVAGTDYNTTTANTIGGLTALVASDVVEVIVYDTFSVFGGNMAADLNFKDNVKANFGSANDLTISHDGSNSIINDAGTGNLQLQLGGSTKLEVQSTGVDVTGTVTADGLTVDGDVSVSSANSRLRLYETDTTDLNTQLQNQAGDFNIQTLNDAASSSTNRISLDHSTGDISFYEDTGTTAKLFWDASAEALGIGTTSHYDASTKLTVAGRIHTSNGTATGGFNYGGGTVINMGAMSNHPVQFIVNNDTKALIDTSGNILVGTTDTTVYDNNAGSSADNGINIRGDGKLDAARYAGIVLGLNRTGTDGTIAEFRKSGSVVGTIGSNAYGDITISGTTNTYVGTNFRPITDNSKDLGYSSFRFQNIYASGSLSDGTTSRTITDIVSGGGGAAPTISVFTSSGTWTRPTDCIGIKVTVIGGGGGGGGGYCSDTTSAASGSGGGAGGCAIEYVSSPASSYTVTIGSGGAGTTSTSTASSGGTSSFGAICSATGGAGGIGRSTTANSATEAGGNGGSGSGGNLNLQGGDGQRSTYGNYSSGVIGGRGGDSFVYPGGRGGQKTGLDHGGAAGAASGSAGSYGSGGGGGSRINSVGYATGASGGAGIVIVEEFY